MKIPFLSKPATKKITGEAFGTERAELTILINKFLHEFPELLAITIVEIRTKRTLVAYTALATFDPYKLSVPDSLIVKQFHQALTAPWLVGQHLNDIAAVFENQLHLIRPLANQQRYCFLAVRTSDTNMAMAREVMRTLIN